MQKKLRTGRVLLVGLGLLALSLNGTHLNAGEEMKWVRCLGGRCYEFKIFTRSEPYGGTIYFKTITTYLVGNTNKVDNTKTLVVSNWQVADCLRSTLNGQEVMAVDRYAREASNSSLLRYLCKSR